MDVLVQQLLGEILQRDGGILYATALLVEEVHVGGVLDEKHGMKVL